VPAPRAITLRRRFARTRRSRIARERRVTSTPAPADSARVTSPKSSEGERVDEVAPQVTQPAPRGAEVQYGGLEDLHPVGHGDDVLGAARQLAGPRLELIRLRRPAQEDDALSDLHRWVGERARGVEDALQPRADLLVVCDRLDVDVREHQGEVRLGAADGDGGSLARHLGHELRGHRAPQGEEQHRPYGEPLEAVRHADRGQHEVRRAALFERRARPHRFDGLDRAIATRAPSTPAARRCSSRRPSWPRARGRWGPRGAGAGARRRWRAGRPAAGAQGCPPRRGR
jgi:hypothetical protein